MIVVVALAVGALLGAGVHLMLRRDALELAAGTLLVTNAAVLLLVSAGFGAESAPFVPVDDPRTVADPLVQALALTAVVIAFGTTVLLLRVALAVERTHDSLSSADLVAAEVEHGEAQDRADAEAGP